jgi:hypothetical protein
LWRGGIKTLIFQHINDYNIQPLPQDRINMSPDEIKKYIADRVAAILKDEGFLHYGKDSAGVRHLLACILSRY